MPPLGPERSKGEVRTFDVSASAIVLPMNFRAAVAASVLTVSALSGCSAPDPGTATPGQGRSSSATDQQTKATKASTASFKDAVTYRDGLAVEVMKVRQGKIPDFASGGKPGKPMTSFTIRIRNGSKAAYDATLVSPSVTYGKDGDQAEGVFTDKIGGGMRGKILPGKAQTAVWAFAIPTADLGDVTMQVALGDLEHATAIFTGSAK